jgi:hypothetical protein
MDAISAWYRFSVDIDPIHSRYGITSKAEAVAAGQPARDPRDPP